MGVVVLRPYVIRVMFADGLVREVDLEPEFRGPVSNPSGIQPFSRRARIEPGMGVVEWPNGVDFAPEFMYRAGRVIAEAQTV